MHTVAAHIAYGCSLQYIRLQLASAFARLGLPRWGGRFVSTLAGAGAAVLRGAAGGKGGKGGKGDGKGDGRGGKGDGKGGKGGKGKDSSKGKGSGKGESGKGGKGDMAGGGEAGAAAAGGGSWSRHVANLLWAVAKLACRCAHQLTH